MWTLVNVITAVGLFTGINVFLQRGQTKEVDVVIVGAGPSGIAAASRLLENGVDKIVVLEAEDRIGGRIHTIPLDYQFHLTVELVIGDPVNGVVDLGRAVRFNEKEESEQKNSFPIEESGELVDRGVSAEYMKIYEEISASTRSQLHNYTGSLGQYYTQQFPSKLEEHSISDRHLDKQFLSWFEKAENIMDASDSWFYTSGRGETVYRECSGNLYWAWKTGGYHTVLHLLMKKLPDESQQLPVLERVSLRSEVTEIAWVGDDKVQVTCGNGVTYLTPQVIVTTSLGVLKHKAHSIFQPPLPPTKLNAIRGLSFGTVDKIYLKFPYKWWPDNYTAFSFLYQKENHPCRTKDCWFKDLFAFNTVYNHPLLLAGWISGPAARIMEQLPVEEVKQESVRVLQKFVGKALNVSVPEPQQIIRTKWHTNPHFRGSYSYRSLKTEAMGVSAADLAEPLLNTKGLP
ncbi:hypothetical protein L9F63_013141, partial [Diploptera punctata]